MKKSKVNKNSLDTQTKLSKIHFHNAVAKHRQLLKEAEAYQNRAYENLNECLESIGAFTGYVEASKIREVIGNRQEAAKYLGGMDFKTSTNKKVVHKLADYISADENVALAGERGVRISPETKIKIYHPYYEDAFYNDWNWSNKDLKDWLTKNFKQGSLSKFMNLEEPEDDFLDCDCSIGQSCKECRPDLYTRQDPITNTRDYYFYIKHPEITIDDGIDYQDYF